MKKVKYNKSDTKLAWLLLSPSIFLLALLVIYPMISNIQISFLKLPLNPYLPEKFIGLKNYLSILKDIAFWMSILRTVLYTFFSCSWQYYTWVSSCNYVQSRI